jgi:hypothetical protein
MMQNKTILKRILPFLFVFVFSFVIAGSEYVKQISAPTEAADESVSVSLANVAAPLEEGSEWKWNAIIFVDSYFKQPINAEYSVHWCSSTEAGTTESEKTSCSPFSDPAEFRKTLKIEPLVITSRQTTHQIVHPGVSCGRVQVDVKRGEESLGKKLFDTGVSCSEFGLASLEDGEEVNEGTIFRDMLLSFLGMSSKLDKVGNDEDRSGGDPLPEGSEAPPPQGPSIPGVPSPILGPANPPILCNPLDKIFAPNTTYKPGNIRNLCMTPTRIVIHWSGGWNTAEATLATLNARGLSCQFASDSSHSLQMLDLSNSLSEYAWCVGGNGNDGSLNIEITGTFFDEVITNQNHSRYKELINSTRRSVALTCWMLDTYHLNKNTSIFPHYDLHNGKADPGQAYFKFFKQEVNKAC